jgi:cobalt-zinc-cadmium efflux system protein
MSHEHHHHHEVKSYNRSFAIGIVLNIAFVIIEISYGIMADSLALIADAGHNLSDVFSLLLAWGATFLASKKPTQTRTYGFKKATILASLISSVLLIVALISIAYEAYNRFFIQETVNSTIVIIVAAVGVVINALTASLFFKDQAHDLNIKAAYLHMVVDAAISFGVVLAGVAIIYTGWLWIDPLISLFIVFIVLFGTWELLIDSVNLTIDAVPKDIDIAEVEAYLLGVKNVSGVHDLHVWAISTNQTAISAHLTTTNDLIDNCLLEKLQEELQHKFSIAHATIQIEKDCELNRCSIKDKCI